ncbi:MAG: hypothetical protein HY720_16150 [Planctomycetes bacterium]|nr:hypothetical protein [Planctomycetota bacterium]
MDAKMLAEFRKRVIEDAGYRKKFCDDPVTALKDVGIDVPQGTAIPKLDQKDLDDRISNLRAQFGAKIGTLYSADFSKKISGGQLDLVNKAFNFGAAFGGIGPVAARASVAATVQW